MICYHQYTFLWNILAVIAAVSITTSTAFHAHSPSLLHHRRATTAIQSTSSSSSNSNNDILIHDIEELREEASHRLDALMIQMEELKRLNSQTGGTTSDFVSTTSSNSDSSNNHVTVVSPKATTSTITKPLEKKKTKEDEDIKEKQTRDWVLEKQKAVERHLQTTPLNLLDDTVWKIVFNIGREPNTWMSKEWGISGDRLLFQCSVEFTSNSINTNKDTKHLYDEFFQGNDENVKTLLISDAFIIPRGVGTNSVGRRPLPVQPIGAYKVCHGQGPAGTDIVRLYIELTDTVTFSDHISDVICPSGRIYGTCGYFNMPTIHPANQGPTYRDIVQAQYTEAVHTYESMQSQVDNDEHIMLSWDHIQLIKDTWYAKQHMETIGKELQVAKQREPEKSQLRLSKNGNVGLSKEGGVCCKVQKGLALEYHILGRMEVGFVEDHHHH